MYRLSDGRPFRHFIGAPIDDVVASSGSPLIVLVTRRGLVRLHCFAHSLFAVDAPWRPGDPMAQLVVGDDVRLLGWPAGASEPWSVPIGGSTAAGIAEPIAQEPTNVANAAEQLKQMRDAAQGIARAGGVHLSFSSGEATTFVAAPKLTNRPRPRPRRATGATHSPASPPRSSPDARANYPSPIRTKLSRSSSSGFS